VTALVAVPVAALVVAWWLTRTSTVPTATGGHDHTTMAAPVGAASPVSLTGDQARRIGVTFAPVTASVLPREIRTVGQVTVDETRVQTIAPKIDGWVEQLYVNFTGRVIQRGEPLMRVYSPMLVTAQEELLLAQRLVGDVAGGAPDAQAGAADLVASARRRLAYWDIQADEIAAIERSGQVQRTLTLRSSATGVVVEKNVTTGQRIMAGEALFRVADLTTVWVEADVYEQDLRAIRTGQIAVAEFDAYPGERWTGRIAYVYPTLDTETRTVRVRVALANAGVRLKPGMYATLRITGASSATGAAVLTVPRGAVLSTGERTLVFVRRADGRLEPRSVQVGAASDDRIEILRGVALGDTVVASATFLVDAESNLGTALGGMGDMPGMEITVPPTSTPSRAPADPGSRPAPRPARPMPDMRMPDTSGTSGTPGTPGTPGRPNPTEPLPSTATRGGETHAGHGGR
jgi:Cu(I)/Ag(I) efflux system membrane fusion protein